MIRLNLGCGESPIDGYDNSYDNNQGKQAYPLPLPDGSVDEVRASHLLEHFGHRGTNVILKEWARVLRLGGLMRVAVPDFEAISRMYVKGEEGQFQGWVSGGQVDTWDSHLSIFDYASLATSMREAGLAGIHYWTGEGDCSELPISLNLAGYKKPKAWPEVAAAMSRPRLGFMDQFGCALDALQPLGIPVITRTGALWGKCMGVAIQAALDLGAEYVLTLDYDTLFDRADIEDLLAFAMANPEADAFVPAQMTRVEGLKNPLLFNPLPTTTTVTEGDLHGTYYPILTGHFGCTLFRASAFAKLPKPWFFPTFKEGGAHQYDDDINFWLSFNKAELKAVLVPRVVVGHLEAVVMWPDSKLRMLYQRTNDYRDKGRPRNAWR